MAPIDRRGDEEIAHKTGESAYDLKFIAVDQEISDGGWYRELPDAHIEVMSHARLERVPVGTCTPEEKAREVVAEIAHKPK